MKRHHLATQKRLQATLHRDGERAFLVRPERFPTSVQGQTCAFNSIQIIAFATLAEGLEWVRSGQCRILCDLVRLKVADVYAAGAVKERTSILQSKTQSPVRFEITDGTRKSLAKLWGRYT